MASEGWFRCHILPPVPHLARRACYALSRTDHADWEVSVPPDSQEHVLSGNTLTGSHNADQTVIWFMDDARYASFRYGGVWCSLNRKTGEFVGRRRSVSEGCQ